MRISIPLLTLTLLSTFSEPAEATRTFLEGFLDRSESESPEPRKQPAAVEAIDDAEGLLQKTISQVQAECEKLTKEIDDLTPKWEEAQKKHKDLSDNFKRMSSKGTLGKTKQQTLKKGIEEANSKFAPLDKALTELKSNLHEKEQHLGRLLAKKRADASERKDIKSSMEDSLNGSTNDSITRLLNNTDIVLADDRSSPIFNSDQNDSPFPPHMMMQDDIANSNIPKQEPIVAPPELKAEVVKQKEAIQPTALQQPAVAKSEPVKQQEEVKHPEVVVQQPAPRAEPVKKEEATEPVAAPQPPVVKTEPIKEEPQKVSAVAPKTELKDASDVEPEKEGSASANNQSANQNIDEHASDSEGEDDSSRTPPQYRKSIDAAKSQSDDEADTSVVPTRQGYLSRLYNAASTGVSLVSGGVQTAYEYGKSGASYALDGASYALDKGAIVYASSKNLATNTISRSLTDREERYKKGICPLLSIDNFLDWTKTELFPDPAYTDEKRRTLMSKDFFCNAALRPKWFDVMGKKYNDKPGYYAFLVKVTAGTVHLVHNDGQKEHDLATGVIDTENKRKARMFRKALLSVNKENQLVKYSGTFLDEAISPIATLEHIKRLLHKEDDIARQQARGNQEAQPSDSKKTGGLHQFFIDSQRCQKATGLDHTQTLIVESIFAFDEDEGKAYHVTLYFMRYWGQLTDEKIAQKYAIFSKDPRLGAILK